MHAITIKELIEEDDFLKGYEVMQQLRGHLQEKEYLKLLDTMKKEGYKQFALFENEEMKAITGIAIVTNFYNGRHVYVYDLVTKEKDRSKGFGEQLLRYVEEWGKENECQNIVLSSGLQRENAHRFYEKKMAFERKSYVFVKEI